MAFRGARLAAKPVETREGKPEAPRAETLAVKQEVMSAETRVAKPEGILVAMCREEGAETRRRRRQQRLFPHRCFHRLRHMRNRQSTQPAMQRAPAQSYSC